MSLEIIATRGQCEEIQSSAVQVSLQQGEKCPVEAKLSRDPKLSFSSK